MPASSLRVVGWLAAAGVLLIWSSWVVISRLGVVETLTIYDMTAVRFLVTSIAVLPLLVRHWPRKLDLWKTFVLSTGLGVPCMLLAFAGMQYAPASHAGTLMYGTLPVFAAALGWIWLKSRPDAWKSVGMAVILSGCALIGWSSGSGEAVAANAWVGHLLLLGSACAVAAYLTATTVWGVAPMQALVSIPIVNLAWFGPVYLWLLPKKIGSAPVAEILTHGLCQGLGPGVAGVLCFMVAVRSIGPMLTSTVLAGAPGVVSLLAIPVLGEWPDRPAWAGLALATAGILLAAGWTPKLGRGSCATRVRLRIGSGG